MGVIIGCSLLNLLPLISPPPLLPRDRNLVDVEVTAFDVDKSDDSAAMATVKVTRVYFGPATLVGQSFQFETCTQNKQGSFFNSSYEFRPSLKKSETGIWWIDYDEIGKTLRPDDNGHPAVRRIPGWKWAAEGEAWAKTVEALGKLAPPAATGDPQARVELQPPHCRVGDSQTQC